MTNKEALEYMKEVFDNLSLQRKRVLDLFKLTTRLSNKDPKEVLTSIEEILRATVVLLHAIFEDALREIVRLKLSEQPVEILKNIPLVGISPTGHPQKFSLMELNKYKGKTVDDLIRESIDEFLDRTSFNSPTDVATMLGRLQIDVSNVRKYFANLDQMMLRRHQIVHRADKEGTPGNWRLASIKPNDLGKWMATVYGFITAVTFLVITPELYEEIAKVREFKESTKIT